MQIIEYTPTVLKLQNMEVHSENAPVVFFFPIFILVGLFLVGLMVVLFLGRLTTLSCNRIDPAQITCELTVSKLISKSVFEIKQLQRAELKVDRDCYNKYGYQVILISGSKRIPLPQAYTSNKSGSTENVSIINAFLNNPEQSFLKIQQDDRFFPYLLGGIFMLFSGGITFTFLLYKKPILCLFDKSSGQLYVKFENMLSQSYVVEERLSDIIRVEVDESIDSDGDKTYRTELVLKFGKSIYLGHLTNNVEVVKNINQFLSL